MKNLNVDDEIDFVIVNRQLKSAASDPFTILQPEIVLEILAYLSPKALLYTALVSKNWLRPSLSTLYGSLALSKRTVFDRFMSLFAEPAPLYPYGTFVESLTLTGTPRHFKLTPAVFDQVMKTLPNLTTLHLSFPAHEREPPFQFQNLATHNPRLQSLHLTHYSPANDHFLYALFKSPLELRKVSFTSCGIQGRTIRALARHTASLRSLSVLGATVTEKTLRIVWSSCPALEILEMGNLVTTVSLAMLDPQIPARNLMRLCLFSTRDTSTADADTIHHLLTNLAGLGTLAISDASLMRTATAKAAISRIEESASPLQRLYLGNLMSGDTAIALEGLGRWGGVRKLRNEIDVTDTGEGIIVGGGSLWWERGRVASGM